MKSRDEVEKRLRHLRVRYTTQWVKSSQERRHRNCVFNHEHASIGTPQFPPASNSTIAPRKSVSLVVLQEPTPVCLCMYGSDDPSKWQGNLCDNDETARSCPMFKPLKDAEQARQEFETKLADDEWVLNNHRDVATLQWVLDRERVYRMKLSLFQRLILWISVRRAKVPPALPSPPVVDVPDNLWEDK